MKHIFKILVIAVLFSVATTQCGETKSAKVAKYWNTANQSLAGNFIRGLAGFKYAASLNNKVEDEFSKKLHTTANIFHCAGLYGVSSYFFSNLSTKKAFKDLSIKPLYSGTIDNKITNGIGLLCGFHAIKHLWRLKAIWFPTKNIS